MEHVPPIGRIGGLDELAAPRATRPDAAGGPAFADALAEAVLAVDDLQHASEAGQLAFSRGADVDLHDVLIKIEEADIAFKTMMEIRNKLVDAYREVMRMGG